MDTTPRLKNTGWRQRQSILQAFLDGGLTPPEAQRIITEEGDGLLTEEGDNVLTQT